MNNFLGMLYSSALLIGALSGINLMIKIEPCLFGLFLYVGTILEITGFLYCFVTTTKKIWRKTE